MSNFVSISNLNPITAAHNTAAMSASEPPPPFIKLDLMPQDSASMTVEQEQLLKSFMLQSVHLDVSLNEFASHGNLTFVLKNPVASPVECSLRSL